MKIIAKLGLICGALTLAGCDAAFRREAGDMDMGDFGNATMQNIMVASGQVQAPMGHDKYDAPAGNRRLNGKYAANIVTGYVASADRRHPGNTEVVTQTNPAGN